MNTTLIDDIVDVGVAVGVGVTPPGVPVGVPVTVGVGVTPPGVDDGVGVGVTSPGVAVGVTLGVGVGVTLNVAPTPIAPIPIGAPDDVIIVGTAVDPGRVL